jgi:branched-chain amino acid transport system permease protein
MPAALIANVVVSGILTGLVYGLMALGLSVIFGVVRVVNFAHGEMTVVAMYAAFFLFNVWHLDPLVALLPIAAGLFVIGYALQATLINPFVARPEHEQFILLVGIALIITNLLLMVFGPDALHVEPSYAYDSLTVGPLVIDTLRLYAAGAAIVATAALLLFFRYSLTGMAIRACADNLLGAAVTGLDYKRLYAFTFGIGAACAGVAGALMILLADATPQLAPTFTLLAFIIVIVGGLGSMAGALLGGVLIGLSEALAGLFIDPSLKSMVSFGLLVLVLILRPQGLLAGAKSALR